MNFQLNLYQYNCVRNIIARLTLITKYPHLLKPQSSIILNRIINTGHNRQYRIKLNACKFMFEKAIDGGSEIATNILISCTVCVLFAVY